MGEMAEMCNYTFCGDEGYDEGEYTPPKDSSWWVCGKYVPVESLTDSHIKNIVRKYFRRRMNWPALEAARKEYRKRRLDNSKGEEQ